MTRCLPTLYLILALVSQAQQVKPEKPGDRSELQAALSFELSPAGNMPGGWNGGPPGTVFMDDKVFTVDGGR